MTIKLLYLFYLCFPLSYTWTKHSSHCNSELLKNSLSQAALQCYSLLLDCPQSQNLTSFYPLRAHDQQNWRRAHWMRLLLSCTAPFKSTSPRTQQRVCVEFDCIGVNFCHSRQISWFQQKGPKRNSLLCSMENMHLVSVWWKSLQSAQSRSSHAWKSTQFSILNTLCRVFHFNTSTSQPMRTSQESAGH